MGSYHPPLPSTTTNSPSHIILKVNAKKASDCLASLIKLQTIIQRDQHENSAFQQRLKTHTSVFVEDIQATNVSLASSNEAQET